MMILTTLVGFTAFLIGVSGTCDVGGYFSTPFENVISTSNSGCVNYYIAANNGIYLGLTWNDFSCANGQNIQVLDANNNILLDLCVNQGPVYPYQLFNSGAYVIISFINQPGFTISSFVHFNKFDLIFVPPSSLPQPKPQSLYDSNTCGKLLTQQTRMYNANISGKHAWPWHALIDVAYGGRCDGTLINNQWIVTAAQCLTNTNGLVVLGLNDKWYLDPQYGGFDNVTFGKTFKHPSGADIALIKLSRPVNSSYLYTNVANSVCLSKTNLASVGKSATVTGWGQQTNGTLSHLLLDITVPIVAASTNTIVTQDLVSFQQPCFEDVGGPLVVKGDDNRYYLAGVITGPVANYSPNNRCGGGYGLYVNVNAYVDWIQTTVANN